MNPRIKKTAAGILAAGLVLTIGTTAFAVEQVQGKNFSDADGNGVCDNYVSGRGAGSGSGQNGNFSDADGDGICDNFVAGQGQGNGSGQNGNFVDADDDGVCDNYASGQCRGDGSGRGPQGGQRNGWRGGRNR